MRGYLIFFFSIIFLLFTLPDRVNLGSGLPQLEQSVLKKACSSKRQVKRTCAKKCLKHQTHSEKQNAGHQASDCSQQYYALVAPLQPYTLPALVFLKRVKVAEAAMYLSPNLKAEPDPPRFS